MFLRKPNRGDETVYMKNTSTALKTVIGFSAAMTLFATFYASSLLEVITEYVRASGY